MDPGGVGDACLARLAGMELMDERGGQTALWVSLQEGGCPWGQPPTQPRLHSLPNSDPGLHFQHALQRRGLGNSFLGMPSLSLVLGSVMVSRESTWRGNSY